MSAQPDLKDLRVLLRFEEVAWVAECQEYDVVAQGSTMEEAVLRFQNVFRAYASEGLLKTSALAERKGD